MDTLDAIKCCCGKTWIFDGEISSLSGGIMHERPGEVKEQRFCGPITAHDLRDAHQRIAELEAERDRLTAAVCACGDHCQAPGALCVTCAEELCAERDDLVSAKSFYRRQLDDTVQVIHDLSVKREMVVAERDRLRDMLRIATALDPDELIDAAKLERWRASFEHDPPAQWLDGIAACHMLAATATREYGRIKHANRKLEAERDKLASTLGQMTMAALQHDWARVREIAHTVNLQFPRGAPVARTDPQDAEQVT